MSPTRRDVLKSLAIATVAVALSKGALAAPGHLRL
ncbi:MAG: twin-arginine translocation signal domain-containing protein [Thermomicrobiales bacterium]